MNSIIGLSPQQLRRAADIKERIDSLQSQLNSIRGSPARPNALAAPPKNRKMSDAGRARIAAAARARWAKFREKRAAPARKPKQRMGAAAKARLSALAKARWKRVRAAGKTRL